MTSSTASLDEPKDQQRPTSRLLEWLLLLLVAGVAVLARCYRIDQQSVWWDDYNGLIGLRESGFFECLRKALNVNPHTMPLYYVLQYLYSCVFGTSALAMRLFSVTLGILTIPVLYRIGKDTFGRAAGLVAVMCFALSPIHIFHDQSIRQYPLFVLLAACSTYSLLKSTRDSGTLWWALNLVANTLLVWTHVFGVLLIVAEAVFLLPVSIRRFRRAFLWTGVQVLLLAPCAVWLHFMPRVPEHAFSHFRVPSTKEVYFDIFGDDSAGTHFDLMPSGATWNFIPDQWRVSFLSKLAGVDQLVALVFVVSACWLAGAIVSRVLAAKSRKGTGTPDFAGPLLLLSIGLLPAILLAAVSYAWRPCTYPRYTMFSSLALYIALGGLVQALRFRVPQMLAVVFVVALYAYELSFVLPAATRTDWKGAESVIRSQAGPDDIILVGGMGPAYPNLNVFCFNVGSSDWPIAPAHTLQAVCDKTLCHLSGSTLSDRPRSVWFVINRLYNWVNLRNLDECLTARGLTFQHIFFPAMEMLSLYRIQHDPTAAVNVNARYPLVETDFDYEQLARQLVPDLGEGQDKARLISALRRIHDDGSLPPPEQVFGTTAAYLLEDGDADVTLTLAKEKIRVKPADADGQHLMASSLLLQGKGQEALESIRQAIAQISPTPDALMISTLAYHSLGRTAEAQQALERLAGQDQGILRPLMPVLGALLDNDLSRGREEAFRVRSENVFIPRTLLEALGAETWASPCPLDANPDAPEGPSPTS